MPTIPTIKIVNPASPTGTTTINECDFDPEKHTVFSAEPEPFSREAIEAIADKDELVELLDAHGVKADKRQSVENLRAQLIAVMFVEA